MFDCTDVKPFENDIKRLNKEAIYYFVLYENNTVLLERASLINGKPKDIKTEKEKLIRELNELKGKK